MNNRPFLFLIINLFLLTISISCSKLEREKDTLELYTTSLLINQEGGEECIDLMANGLWEIQDIPDWISASPTSGDGYGMVTIKVAENKGVERRKASLQFSHGKATETLEVEQLSLKEVDPFLEFSRNPMDVGCFAGTQTIKLTTNRPWEVYIVPKWISITPSSGDESTEITINIAENRSPDGRQAKVVFSGEFGQRVLEVNQSGLRDIAISPGLPIFSFKQLEFTGDLSWCNAWTNSMFINPAIQDKIYLGNLVSHNAQSNINIPEFIGYTFNPITVSTSAAVEEVVKTYVPSQKEQDTFARQIMENMSDQNVSFEIDNGTFDFYSHKQLYMAGMINLGVKLDEAVSGVSFLEKEMPRKYGLIYSFKQILFTLDMDRPEKLIKEELKEVDKGRGVSYVASVSYGRIGLLVVESDIDSRDVRLAINKVIAGESLSQEETNILSAVDVCYVYFDKDKNVQTQKGGLDVVNAYKEAILKEKDCIYPVEFSLSDYTDHSLNSISFSCRAEE